MLTTDLATDFLLSAEAARVLGITPDAVRQMELRGVLRAVRTASGVRLFSRADIEQLAAERARRREATESAAR